MDVMVKLTVSGSVYRFYRDAAQHVSQCSTEDIMSHALSGYAGMLSKDIAQEREQAFSEEDRE